jgi:hypothetical protein
MAGAMGHSYVAECFWSGVREEDLLDVDRRIGLSAAELNRRGDAVEYVGSMVIVDDDVVLCLFEGPIATVRQVMEDAGIAFERILQSTRAPWRQRSISGGQDSENAS